MQRQLRLLVGIDVSHARIGISASMSFLVDWCGTSPLTARWSGFGRLSSWALHKDHAIASILPHHHPALVSILHWRSNASDIEWRLWCCVDKRIDHIGHWKVSALPGTTSEIVCWSRHYSGNGNMQLVPMQPKSQYASPIVERLSCYWAHHQTRHLNIWFNVSSY